MTEIIINIPTWLAYLLTIMFAVSIVLSIVSTGLKLTLIYLKRAHYKQAAKGADMSQGMGRNPRI